MYIYIYKYVYMYMDKYIHVHASISERKINKHAKFIIIDKLTNTKKPKGILRQRLIQRENFWIQTLDTIYPEGLNQKLSK